MRTLIVPDVHQKLAKLDAVIANAGAVDRTVFLGDWFDDFHDTPDQARATAHWLVKRIETHPGDVFLLGNHDWHYRFPFRGMRCSGYHGDKLRAIRSVMRPEHWDVFGLFAVVDDWYLSHAGLARRLAHPLRGFDASWLAEMEREAIALAAKQKQHPMTVAGAARDGSWATGGVLWLAWDEEFEDIHGVRQIVGHTPRLWPRRKGESWCLDTHLEHYGVIDGGDLLIYNADGTSFGADLVQNRPAKTKQAQESVPTPAVSR